MHGALLMVDSVVVALRHFWSLFWLAMIGSPDDDSFVPGTTGFVGVVFHRSRSISTVVGVSTGDERRAFVWLERPPAQGGAAGVRIADALIWIALIFCEGFLLIAVYHVLRIACVSEK